MELSHEKFLKLVRSWIIVNVNSIKNMWPQKGGWESWAQAEIFNYVITENSTYDILREQHVYRNSALAADFLLNKNSARGSRVIVELKCQSLENHKNFSYGIESDAKKLCKELSDTYSGEELLVIGIYFTSETLIPEYFSSENITTEVGICWAVEIA